MSTVSHMVNWLKSVYGNAEVTLAIRRRSFCGRSIYSIDKLPNSEVGVNYAHTLHRFLNKGYLIKYLKEEKLVEAVSLAFYIKSRNEDFSSVQRTGDPKLQEIQLFLKSELLKSYEPSEWLRRINGYLNKNVAVKKQSDILLKKKFLTLFKDCKFFCSQVYDYKTYKSKIADLPKSGKVCVNVTGVFFFEEGQYKVPNLSIMVNDLVEFEQKGNRLKLKFNEGKSLRTIFVTASASKQLCEDIATSLLLGLRENRYYAYSYLYVNKMLPPGVTASQKTAVEQLHGQRIAKCIENLSSYGDAMMPFKELPFTEEYQTSIRQTAEPGYYYPFQLTDINRDSKKMSAKKNNPLTNQSKLTASHFEAPTDRQSPNRTKSILASKKASTVKFRPKPEDKDESDNSSDEDDQAGNIMINPELLKLKRR